MKGITCIWVLWLALSGYAASAQNDTAFLTKAADAVNRLPAAERVYLHLDKPNYDFGDTIWYKAYTVIGPRHQLSALSGILYVELYGPSGTLAARQLLPMLSGIACGSIPLGPSLKQGIYHIRAYTRWMRNFGTDGFYDRRIRIGGVSSSSVLKTVGTAPDIQFFPEGGNLVNDVRCRVAVKALGSNGLGVEISGVIEDNNGNIVTDFATQHLGMGVFAFIPQSGKAYKAKINNMGEANYSINMPAAKETGITLAVNNNLPDTLFVKVAVNNRLLNAKTDQAFYLIAQLGGKVYYTAKSALTAPVFTAAIAKNRFPSGIVQFTLFNQRQEPVAERIAFIQNADTISLHINATANAYAPRQKVTIALGSKDLAGKTIAGAFSAAVVNETLAGLDEWEENIFSRLLLTSDLKGLVENPAYYFTNVNNETKANLDLLMLTQGYRRFEWKKILNDTTSALIYQPEKSLEIDGRLETPSGKTVAGGKVTLLASKANLLKDTTTDSHGNFRFTDLALPDSTIVLLRARKENNGSNVAIRVSPPSYPAFFKMTDTASRLSSGAVQVLQKVYSRYQQLKRDDSLKNGIRLKQVNIKSYRRKTPNLSASANLHGGGNADQVLMGDDIGLCPNLSDCLLGKLHFVHFSADGVPLQTALIVDGNILPGFHLNELMESEIYSIEVLRRGALSVYGTSVGRNITCILVITTKRGGSGVIDEHPAGILTLPLTGYTPERVFYTPKYSPKNAGQLSLGSTIYWKPNIITDKDGNATFEYFNNDTKGTYRMAVEGIDDDGNLGRAVYRYNVR